MTNPTNETNNSELNHVEKASPDRDRPSQAADRHRGLVDEDLEHDVWLDECLAYIDAQEVDEDPHDS